MKIYISIPITGHDLTKQRAKADHVASGIVALGHEPINPFGQPEPPEQLSEKERYAYYMGFDIADLLRSDAAYFCKGWQDSKGCRLEHAAAEIYGLPIYYALDKISEVE